MRITIQRKITKILKSFFAPLLGDHLLPDIAP